jgi:patatin-like phospholipase/acyl hydrolase
VRQQLDWPREREFRVLSIDGGGIKGIFAAAFLARLEKDFLGGASIARCFDLIAGTSTGGIIALALALGFSANDVLRLYLEHGNEIFSRRRNFGVVQPAFRSAPLEERLATLFGQRLLGDATARLCIPSADGRHGDIAVFKTPHHPDFRRDWSMRAVDVALATSAAPTFLRVQEQHGYRFVDGGVWANNPVMVALVDVLSCFNVLRRQVRIVSIGNGARKPILNAFELRFGGAIGWFYRSALLDSMMYYSAASADGQAGLLVGRDQLTRIEPPQEAASVHMTDYSAAKRILPSLADREADRHGQALAQIVLDDRVTPKFFYGPRAETS